MIDERSRVQTIEVCADRSKSVIPPQRKIKKKMVFKGEQAIN
jgi:hypothetical protein